MKNGFSTIFLIVFLLRNELSATITQGPSNAVAEIGKQVKLNCTATAAIAYWYLSKNGVAADEVIITGIGCSGVNSAFTDHYAVESLGGGSTCNLIVSNITMEQGGVYRCLEGSTQFWSILTVTESSPVITVNNTHDTTTVVEKQSVIIECALNHNGSVASTPTLRPYFYWTNSSGNVSSSYQSTTEYTAVSQITVTAGRENITSYTCHVYLQLIPPTTPNYASNTPTVSSSSSSTIIEVLCGPSPTVMTSRPGVITINDVPCGISVLTCSSTGNPAPSYRWYDSAKNVILSTTNTLDMAGVNGNYKCEAYNTIRSESTTYTVSKDNCTSTVNCCEFPRDDTTLVTTEDCDNGTLCDCSQGSRGIILTCNATSYPNASYMWSGPDGQIINFPVNDQVTMNGTYRCTAYFKQTLSNYTGNVIFPNGTDETTVGRCCDWELVVSVVVQFIGGNVILVVVFHVVYNKRRGFKRIMDNQFPDPTMIKPIPFTIVSIFFGLFVIPIVVTIAYCSSHKREMADKPNRKGSHQRNGNNNPKVSPENARTDQDGEYKKNDQDGEDKKNDQDGEDKKNDQDGEDKKNADPGISNWMITVMWCVVIVFLFPTAFVVVYFVPCNQMRFEIS